MGLLFAIIKYSKIDSDGHCIQFYKYIKNHHILYWDNENYFSIDVINNKTIKRKKNTQLSYGESYKITCREEGDQPSVLVLEKIVQYILQTWKKQSVEIIKQWFDSNALLVKVINRIVIEPFLA